MLAQLKIICLYHAHSVHQNSVEIFWAEIYFGNDIFRAEIYRGRLLALITGSSSRLLRIRFSADLTMYWFLVYHFRCMKFKTGSTCLILLFKFFFGLRPKLGNTYYHIIKAGALLTVGCAIFGNKSYSYKMYS
jgi:hypothetical protein